MSVRDVVILKGSYQSLSSYPVSRYNAGLRHHATSAWPTLEKRAVLVSAAAHGPTRNTITVHMGARTRSLHVLCVVLRLCYPPNP